MPEDRQPSVFWDFGARAWKWVLPIPGGKALEGTEPTEIAARARMEEANRPYRESCPDGGQQSQWAASLPPWFRERTGDRWGSL